MRLDARWLVAAAGLCGGMAFGAPGDPEFRAKDIDFAASRAFVDGQPKEVSEDVLLSVLGFTPQARRWDWRAEQPAGDAPRKVQYRIVFKKPIAVGSVFAAGEFQSVQCLKTSAKAPGDPAKAADWADATVPTRQSGGWLAALDKPVETHALLLTDARKNPGGGLSSLRVFAARLWNVTPNAFAYADREYQPPMSEYVYAAALVANGTGVWQSAGKDNNGRYSSPNVSDINPSWFMLAWPKEQTVRGLWMLDNIVKFELDQYVGPENINPRVGTEKEWKRIREFQAQPAGQGAFGRWVSFKPVTTRGLRIRILKTEKEPQFATISGLHALTDLSDAPLPASPGAAEEPAPLRLAVTTKDAGNLTVVVNGPDGRRAKNLIAREPRDAGKHDLAWDLKDENGNYVAPGEYTWQALSMPPLSVKYWGTVYPNVPVHSPQNPPWITAQNGPGGWLADHTPPVGCCVAGDRVYLSAYVAESGVSFIECDLTGRKLWAHHSFAAWTGPRFLASDGKTVFVGAQVLNTNNDAVWGVDIKSKEVKPVLSLFPTATRKRGLTGMAARPGEVALAVQAKENWLANAAAAEDVDIEKCLPLYLPKRKPRVAYEVIPDQRKDFLRLFRLVEHPPGGETGFTLSYLQSQKSKSNQQHIVLAFTKPVPIGSIVFPVPLGAEYKVRLSTLKPDAQYPPRAEKAADWQPFEAHGEQLWDCVPAPENTVTRALRISFVKGAAAEDDPLATLIEGEEKEGDPADLESIAEEKTAGGLETSDDADRWLGRLEGMKLLRRRFAAALDGMQVRTSSGQVNDAGEWDAFRDKPLTAGDPAIYAMQWDAPRAIRGLAIKEIDAKLTKIDVYTGADSGEVDINGTTGWEEVAQYEQQRRDVGNGYGLGFMNPQSRYVDGYVDFGREINTRAIRLRIVEQWADNGQAACMGVRIDRGGREIDAKRCRVYGVTPLAYIGGEPPVESAANDRIEIYNPADGKQSREVAIPKPGDLSYNAKGDLYAVSGNTIVRVDFENSEHQTLVEDLSKPTDLTFDADGNLYVFDNAADRKQVRVYDAKGKFLRAIGKPGGLKAGAWDPERMGDVTAIDVDQTGQLWVVENQYWPKRITVWSTAGKFLKELLGNTEYGGGGVIDPEEPSRIVYGPLEFALDWKTGLSKLKNLTWTGATKAGEVPIRVQDRLYFVTRPQFSTQPVGIVYLYEKDRLKLAAAVGLASAFEPLKDPELHRELGSQPLTQRRFRWCDTNGDGAVQAAEVQLAEKPSTLTNFNSDLGIQAVGLRYVVKEFLPNGAPVYEEEPMPAVASRNLFRWDDGTFYYLGQGQGWPDAGVKADGTVLWTYPNLGPGVQALVNAPPWSPAQVVSQFGIVGHETAADGDLGEFIVIHGNTGEWNIWTRDGLLAGPIFRDLRDPEAKPWSMAEHERGMILKNVTSGQEHFAGYFCRSKDNRYLAVAGHNHASALEVLGIDQAQRMSGKFTVTPETLKESQRWEIARQQEDVYTRSPVILGYRAKGEMKIDGDLKDWPAATTWLTDGPGRHAGFYLAYDDANLYLAFNTVNLGPLSNTGSQWDRLFKTGASVDLQLSTDPAADEARQAPVEGDLRLLLTFVGDKPHAVLYRPVVPGTPEAKQWRVVSPVNEVTFDDVHELEDVQLKHKKTDNGYIAEAAIPLSDLGLEPAPDLRLKLDWGVLTTGPDGNEVQRRLYWSNKATHVIADAPSEARLHPHLWGHILFGGDRPSTEDRLDELADPMKKKKGKDVEDLLEDLEDKKK